MKTAEHKPVHFDYLIVGSGMAGLQLVLRFLEAPSFKNRQIALLDKERKYKNDKTWCFWEKGPGRWDSWIFKQWNRGKVFAQGEKIDLELKPYQYKMIRSIAFYEKAFQRIGQAGNIEFLRDEVNRIDDRSRRPVVYGKKNTYSAEKVFDSRIPTDFFKKDRYTRLIQHFKAFVIETEKEVFDDTVFTMMDYRIKYPDSTSFTYVLPFSPRKALVEFTFFNLFTVKDEVYDDYLRKYCAEILKLKEYKITEFEKGKIPMSDFPFANYQSENVIKIGTAAGWVKASSGYAFKNTERKIDTLMANLEKGESNPNPRQEKRFSVYDSVFLKVLADDNAMGETLFHKFYKKNKIEKALRFLDETSRLNEELQIISSLYSTEFIKAALKIIRRKFT